MFACTYVSDLTKTRNHSLSLVFEDVSCLRNLEDYAYCSVTVSKLRLIMSAVGMTLLHSPGCNEGKARYETLGIHERKVISSSVGTALEREHLSYVSEVPPPLGLNKCVSLINPGLAPWAMQEYRPCRAHLRCPPPNQLLCCFDAGALFLLE